MSTSVGEQIDVARQLLSGAGGGGGGQGGGQGGVTAAEEMRPRLMVYATDAQLSERERLLWWRLGVPVTDGDATRVVDWCRGLRLATWSGQVKEGASCMPRHLHVIPARH